MAKNTFRRHLVAGLTGVLPTLLTILVFYKVWQYANDSLGRPIVAQALEMLQWKQSPPWLTIMGGVVAFLIMVLAVLTSGLLFSSLIGSRIFSAVEARLTRMPVISAVYNPLRQVTDFFFSKKSQLFRSVVAVEYPRKGMYSIGFVTSSGLKDVTTPDGGRMVGVFVPSSPTPFTGYTILVTESDLIPLPIAVEEALRFVISGGVIRPPSQVPVSEMQVSLPAGPPPKVEVTPVPSSTPESDS
ncbi:MAG TPA: DUF502 domain-containing protein [Hyphomicrobiaceae bacterium]|nr:DUF502 domain-containing protein [Hyphomicrobiaceae bacterium]